MKSSSLALRICAALLLLISLASFGLAQNREKFVISAKAGGVNSVVGQVWVTRSGHPKQLLTAQDNLVAGDLVTTGTGSRVEVLLNPGSYLRVGENSEFQFADTSLDKLRVQLNKGSAIVEAMGLENTELHISIVTKSARLLIARRGVYRINATSDSAELLVRKGRVQINDDARNVIKSGNQVSFRNGSFLTSKLGKSQDQFDEWSKERANTLARANEKLSARGLNTYLSSFSYFDWAFSAANPYGLWTFSPFSRCFTFLPFYYGWSSPYGHYYGLYYGFYDYWPGRECCGGTIVRHRGVINNPPSSGGGSGGPSGGGPSRGSIGPGRGPTPPSSAPSRPAPRDPDSGGRSIPRIKNPIN